MMNWKNAVIRRGTPVKEALRIIDAGGIQAVAVVDDDGKLCGIVTDADIRRGLLKGLTVESPATEIMNESPRTVKPGTSQSAILNLMKKSMLRQIPVVDDGGRLVGIEIMDDYLKSKEYDNAVVLMAGGLGRRLHPLTLDCPKPMLKVGGKPILEIIVENFIKAGFRKFFLSVNYKAEMVEACFGDGSRFGAEIKYLREEQKMGTAGSLSMLPELQDPVIVMNGDLLTNVNFEQLLAFHHDKHCAATMCVRPHSYEVPFGVVNAGDGFVSSIEEKPSYSWLVSGGIYVLNPEVISRIPKNTPVDMPRVFNELIQEKQKVGAFLLREYWLDIGRASDLERAMDDVAQVIGMGEK